MNRRPARPGLLGAAIIVRNEADHLRRCLGSLRGLCDEIVVVDTGSTDDTVEVARAHGANILHKVWRDDFAASRNLALDAVDTEWVLYIDADEEVVDTDIVAVRELLGSSPGVMAFGIQMILKEGWTPYTDFRIWRHHPGIRFRGMIHETSMGDIVRIARETGRSLAALDLVIQHHGYGGDQTAKHRRNLPLLRAELAESPDNLNLWNHLGRVYRDLGMVVEAESTWWEGVRRVRTNGLRSPIDVHVYASLVDLMSSRGEDPTALLAEARSLDPAFHTLDWLEARHLMGTDRPEEAEPFLRELIGTGERGPDPSMHSYDRDMFDRWPRAALAASLFGQCRFSEAVEPLSHPELNGLDPGAAAPRAETCRRALEYMNAPRPNQPPGRSFIGDVTFVMAVRVDSAERLRSALATVSRIVADFDAPFVVGCDQPDSFAQLVPAGVTVVGINCDPNHPFHATRALNELTAMVRTGIRVHLEPGAIVPAEQVLEALRRIRDRESDLVVPFSFGLVVPSASQGDFIAGRPEMDPSLRLRPVAGTPDRGCQVWSAAAFGAVGGENEFIIGEGPHDRERIRRARMLGYRTSEVAGPVFFLADPSPATNLADATYREWADRELERVGAMSGDELRAEVADWPWMRRGLFVPPDQIDAHDLTATIPVRLDSEDRLRNLVASTNALAHGTTARILVGIGEPGPLLELQRNGVLHPRVEVVEVHDPPDGPFHRTRILNDLARRVTTAFVANLDADVVVPLDQWRHALDMLRSGEARLVLPYDGRMVGVPFAHHPWLERADYDTMPRAGRTMMHPNSVGGCVVWNRATFLEVGMENEHLVSWGFDDDERVARAATLGVDVRRVPGVVYHLDHRRGPDSRPDHPFLESNQAVCEAVRLADADTLRAEVSRWPWANGARRVTVLVWGDTWHPDAELFPMDEANLHVTRDRSRLGDADVVVFPLPVLDRGDIPVARGRADQQWLLLCRESGENFPELFDPGFRAMFDMVSSYELASDLPMPYATGQMMARPGPIVPWAERTTAPACAWVSSPWNRSGRRDFMAELMLHMQVDSYGLVLNNTGDRPVLEHRRRLEITSRYRFALALENSVTPDYVTEKVFEALSVGAVPVYLGAPNVARFLPGDNCIVNASDFATVAELAAYLGGMGEDDYMGFHAWRERPLRAEFLEVCEMSGSLVSWLRARCAAVR